MNRCYELVLYPFKIHNIEEMILYRIEDNFEMRFSKDLFAKRVCSTKTTSSVKNYIEIEITDEEVVVMNKSDSIHQFKTPADFYVEIPTESREFYESLHSALVDQDISVLFKKATEIDSKIKESGFPEIPVPLTTTSSHFENFETATANLDHFPKIPVTQIKHGDPIPVAPINKTRDLLESALTKQQYDAQEQFYKDFFSRIQITRFRTVAMSYEEQSVEFKRKISLNILKKCIGMHAYFVISGPWRKCWIHFGYDPVLDQDNYKYQLVEFRTKKANFQVFQKPEIIAEVSKNKDWYLLKECDPVDGFISKSLKNFIIYTIDNVGQKDIDKKIDELHDSDFEFFEI